MTLIFDTGRYWFRMIKKNGQKQIQRVDAPEHYEEVVEEAKWRSTRFSKLKDRRNKLLLNKIDNFFETSFANKNKDAAKAIFKHDGFHYRLHEHEGKNCLERCMAPALFYQNSNVNDIDTSWKTVHNGDSFLIKLSEDSLKEINDYFQSNFTSGQHL